MICDCGHEFEPVIEYTHKLYCADSTVKENVEVLMGGEKAVLMATDPPYGDSWVAKAQDMQAQGFGHSHAGLHGDIENDDLNEKDLYTFLCAFLEAAKSAGDPPMPFYIWHGSKRMIFEQALKDSGYFTHQHVIWVKPSFVIGRLHYHPRAELALHGWRTGNGKCSFYGEKNQSDVWEVDRENDKIHPTQKPVQIFETPIWNHAKSFEIIYEPFAGSGTAMVAAERTGRRAFCLELSPAYCSIILQRMVDAFDMDVELIRSADG